MYNAATLSGLLVALAESLVPHLTRQVRLFISMRDMCLGLPTLSRTASADGGDDMPSPLPAPMATMSRTGAARGALRTPGSRSASPPVSSSSSSSSSSSTSSSSCASPVSAASSSTTRSTPTVSFSLFPTPSSSPRHGTMAAATTTTTSTNDASAKAEPGHHHPATRSIALVDMETKSSRPTHARVLLAAEDRAAKLMQVYLSADARATASMDHFVVPPMIVRLRDTTTTAITATTSTTTTTTTTTSHASGGRVGSTGLGTDAGTAIGMVGGGGHAGDWPRLSIPAVHAIADKLSPRHEGAWRFLPCDVWGRPRELPFSG
ncbi:hypothetical protein F5Y14DRAFT_398498 [Nemania sp. NC0429]|nr:hypothetical protein F5Y14DRAFT_398498 [Nemania sp. NC0429]